MLRAVLCLFAVSALFFSSCSKEAVELDVDVMVWHWMTDRQDAFEKLAKDYFTKTGVKVIFETYAPSDVYKNKISAAATANLLPEIFNPMANKKEIASYINAGFVADITDDMNKDNWKDVFFQRALENLSFEENNEWGVKSGIYGVPIDVSSMLIYYNKDLFRQAGLDPEITPKTWGEFVAFAKKLKANDIQPFVSGFGENWIIGAFAQSYQWELFGKEGILSTIDGVIPYTDARWVKIFNLFKELKDNNLLATGVVTMINKDAERGFATGKFAMAFNGSWGVNVYNSMNPNLNYGVFYLPILPEAQHPMRFFGGEGSAFYVNSKSPNKQKAIDFLKWFTSEEQQSFLSKATSNIPANKNASSDLPPILKIFAESIANTFGQLQKIEDWQVVNVLNTSLQSVIIGEKTPQKAAKDVQDEKARQMKNKKATA
ncbi:MAG: extracellular solute-binding protein [Elusimicrobiota bacterium]|jgi:ABC-type glycerol-3-phosphate transport system substrate-binding protein|nr:extracellular solute-binding protein [Elusimicrobiota bacterium]